MAAATVRPAAQWAHAHAPRGLPQLRPPPHRPSAPASRCSTAAAAREVVRQGVPGAHPVSVPAARRPQRRLGAEDPARAGRHLPARRGRDLPGRGLVVARRRRPDRGAGRAHRRDGPGRPVAGPPRPRGRGRGAHRGLAGTGRARHRRRRERRLAGDAEHGVVPRHRRHLAPGGLARAVPASPAPLRPAGGRPARPRAHRHRARRHHRSRPGGRHGRRAGIQRARPARPRPRDRRASVDGRWREPSWRSAARRC